MARIFPLALLVLALPIKLLCDHGRPFSLGKLSRGNRRYRSRRLALFLALAVTHGSQRHRWLTYVVALPCDSAGNGATHRPSINSRRAARLSRALITRARCDSTHVSQRHFRL